MSEEIKNGGVLDITETGTVILADGAVYAPREYVENKPIEEDFSVAYIKGDSYFPYRGKYFKDALLPGIYVTKHGDPRFVYPITPEQIEEYKTDGRIVSLDLDNMVNVLSKPDSITYGYPSSNKHFIPDISNDDDILKRALKIALKAKCVDIDSCKDNFTDRNALFNFKSVMKGDGRLSILLFDRGCEALGLEYYVVLKEKDPKHPIGTSLTSADAVDNIGADMNRLSQNYRNDSLDLNGKIVVSTEDTYAT